MSTKCIHWNGQSLSCGQVQIKVFCQSYFLCRALSLNCGLGCPHIGMNGRPETAHQVQ